MKDTPHPPPRLSDFFGHPSVPLITLPWMDAIWDRLIAEAASQWLLPALNQQLTDLKLADKTPWELLHLFATVEQLNAERNEVMLDEAVHIAALLNQIGIRPVALKGLAYLLTGVYAKAASRYLLDLDFLLSPTDLPLAIGHLRKNGYFENEPGHLVQFRHHYPSICRLGKPQVEVHHRVGQGVCSRLLPAQQILENARPLSFKKANFLIPSPTDLVNHLVLHSQLSHPYHDRVFPPLRALVDLVHIENHFTNKIDWQQIRDVYAKNGESATLLLHLKQAQETVAFKIPDEMTINLTPLLTLRAWRRKSLNDHPHLRFADPIYILMSMFSRRLRIVPEILRTPSCWPAVLRLLTSRNFYRNLIAV